jgi:hypothetical protein
MKKIFFLLPLASIVTTISNAQGCSDAGFCTIHSIKNNTSSIAEDDKKNNDIAIGFAFGKGERHTSVYTPYIEYTRSITNQTSVTGKISFSAVSGELANTSGAGDLFVSVNHAIDSRKKWQKSFVIGLKIPFDQADIVKKGIHLPMPYQTSLGTTDLVLGLSYIRKNFGTTLALQQPLKKMNGNHFLPGDYPAEPLAAKYLPSNLFERKGDALLRFSYNFQLNNSRFSVRPSLLGIYHLGNDSYSDMDKMRMEIKKSSGLTLNGNVFIDYRINKTSVLELSAGAPFVVRTNRPDGLTRSLVAALEYKISF